MLTVLRKLSPLWLALLLACSDNGSNGPLDLALRGPFKFFKMYLPGFRYIPPNKYEAKEGLQMRLDAWSGLCVTWSILYLHYRVLNPNVNPKDLINYLEKKITKSVLLRYTRYVEEVLKDKV